MPRPFCRVWGSLLHFLHAGILAVLLTLLTKLIEEAEGGCDNRTRARARNSGFEG